MNTLIGGGGDDTLDGGTGADILTGGDGDDTYVLGAENDVVNDPPETRDTSGGNDTITSTITRSLAGYAMIENLTLLGTAAINGTGNDLLNYITGNSGNNILDGGEAGGLDTDTLDGGAGNDTYVLNDLNVTVIDASGIDTATSTTSRFLSNPGLGVIENLTLLGTSAINGTGNALANVITGNSNNNTLNGGTDSLVDTLIGAAGNDTYVLAGGTDVVNDSSGIDTIRSTISRSLVGYSAIENLTLEGAGALTGTGNNSDNVIIGSAAANVLIGGVGEDTMTGAAGIDRFDFNTVAEIGNGATRDVITDFLEGTDDIDLSTIDANGAAAGHTFSFLAPTAQRSPAWRASCAGSAELRRHRQRQDHRRRRHQRRHGVADFQIQLTGLKTLTIGDFFL